MVIKSFVAVEAPLKTITFKHGLIMIDDFRSDSLNLANGTAKRLIWVAKNDQEPIDAIG